jgi:SAM-dependent methyltransferase
MMILSVIKRCRNIWFSFFLSYPKTVECNVCGWTGRHFRSDSWHKFILCPSCNSDIRHRLLIAALNLIPDLSYDKIINGKNILHFAPEPGIMSIVKKRTPFYKTADFLRNDVDFQTDISEMANIISETYDLVIACDVLEHVKDDKKAIYEINRILKPGGCAIITIPQKDNLEITYEDADVTSPIQREKLFGQSDHLRIYGADFVKLLESSNFIVKLINAKFFSEDACKKYVLFPPVLSLKPLATNYRTIYFAFKPPLQKNQ